MPTQRRRTRTTPSTSAFRSCVSCGSSNSIRRTGCHNCGHPLKRNRTRAATRRNSGAMSAVDNQEEAMETTSFDGQEVTHAPEEGSVTSSPRPSQQSHPLQPSQPSPPSLTSSPPTQLEEQSTNVQSTESQEQQTNSESQVTTTITNEGTPSPHRESQESHQSPRTHSTPLPDFLSALQMRPATSESVHTPSLPTEGADGSEGMESQGDERNIESSPSLLEKYRKDPGGVLDLLKSALSLERLSQLLNSEHATNTEQLELLQGKLEAAYKTLKDCVEHKSALHKTIEETNDKIKVKRKHLEALREDLRVLGEEEMSLRRRRDSAHSRCSQLKQKLKASREALQQISTLSTIDSGPTKDTS